IHKLAQSESMFLDSVVALARLRGWMLYHPRPARRADGSWRTAMIGHTGYPDLTLVRDGRLLFVELKAEAGRVRDDQRIWLELLGECPRVESHVWRPAQWAEIERVLA